MKKYIALLLMLIFSCTILHAQQEDADSSQSMVVMSEADIVSLAKTLRNYKKDKEAVMSTDTILNDREYSSQANGLKENTYEADYLRNQIAQLENQLDNLNNKQRNNVSGVELSNNNISERELRNLKYEISQLKYAIQQLPNNANDNLGFVASPKNQASNTYQQPRDVIIREQIPVNNTNDVILRQKLDSLNILFKNIKQADSPNYTGDFDALQKRMDALKNEIIAKNSASSNYNLLMSKYKGYNRDVYFADNSIVLNTDASQAIEELFAILDSNNNLDVVVKGFASNKGNALYNENLSMQRTEAVKKALMIRGIHPTRVLTQYHGIDYNAQTATQARRVEVSILVRK